MIRHGGERLSHSTPLSLLAKRVEGGRTQPQEALRRRRYTVREVWSFDELLVMPTSEPCAAILEHLTTPRPGPKALEVSGAAAGGSPTAPGAAAAGAPAHVTIAVSFLSSGDTERCTPHPAPWLRFLTSLGPVARASGGPLWRVSALVASEPQSTSGPWGHMLPPPPSGVEEREITTRRAGLAECGAASTLQRVGDPLRSVVASRPSRSSGSGLPGAGPNGDSIGFTPV